MLTLAYLTRGSITHEEFFSRILGLAVLGFLLTAISAISTFADNSIQLSTNWGTYVWYSFLDTTGAQQSLPVAPYQSTVVVNGVTYPGFLAYYDINNSTYIGGTYTGSFTLPNRSDVLDTEASWLLDKLASRTQLLTPDPNYVGPIAMAIWQMEFPSSTDSEGGGMPIDPAAQAWITKAEAAYYAGYVADKSIFSPDDSSSQRFGVIWVGPVPTPEPGTLVMFGSGVLGLASLLRRKLSA